MMAIHSNLRGSARSLLLRVNKTSYNVDTQLSITKVNANTTMETQSRFAMMNALPVLVGDPAIQWGDVWKRVARDQLEHAGLTFTTLNVCRWKDWSLRNNPVCLFITVDEPESANFIAVQHAIHEACLQEVETWPREDIKVVIQHGKVTRFCSDRESVTGQIGTLMAMGQTVTTETAEMEHLSMTLTCAISIHPHQGEPYIAWLGVHHATSTSNEPVSTELQVLCPSNTTRREMVDDEVGILGDYQKTEAEMKTILERERMRLRDGDLQREPENVKQRIQRLEDKLEICQTAIIKATQRLKWADRESALWRCGSIEKTSGLDQRTAIGGSMDWAVIRPSGENFVERPNLIQRKTGSISLKQVKSVKDLMQSNMDSEVYRYGGRHGLTFLASITFNCIKSDVRLSNGQGGTEITSEYAFVEPNGFSGSAGDSGCPIISKKEGAIYGQVIGGSAYFTYVTDIEEILQSIEEDMNVRSVTLAT